MILPAPLGQPTPTTYQEAGRQVLKDGWIKCELAALTDAPPDEIRDEATRDFVYRQEVASLGRWIAPNDPLPEIPDWLKPKGQSHDA